MCIDTIPDTALVVDPTTGQSATWAAIKANLMTAFADVPAAHLARVFGIPLPPPACPGCKQPLPAVAVTERYTTTLAYPASWDPGAGAYRPPADLAAPAFTNGYDRVTIACPLCSYDFDDADAMLADALVPRAGDPRSGDRMTDQLPARTSPPPVCPNCARPLDHVDAVYQTTESIGHPAYPDGTGRFVIEHGEETGGKYHSYDLESVECPHCHHALPYDVVSTDAAEEAIVLTAPQEPA